MSVQIELKRIIITETSEQQVIYLKEVGGDRSFPIVIGTPEAYAIDRRLKGEPTLRPYTHELLASVIEKMDGKLERIVINDLQDYTFFARLVIRHHGKTVEIDSRPSDAIALGVAANTPIFVAEHVMDEVGN
jgi:bifunctional DNase/RNase